jgi:hypothetical protein
MYLSHELAFGVFPYIAGTVFLLGSLIRYDKSQYTWRAGSSQMLSGDRRSGSATICFISASSPVLRPPVRPADAHGHVHGAGHEPATKQLWPSSAGGIFGLICLVGMVILIHRRTTESPGAGYRQPDGHVHSLSAVRQLADRAADHPGVHRAPGRGVMLQISYLGPAAGDLQAGAAAISWISTGSTRRTCSWGW